MNRRFRHTPIRRLVLAALVSAAALAAPATRADDIPVVTVSGDQILVDGEPTKLVGLRCSNSLVDDRASAALVRALPLYRSYGLNTVAVFVMGSRFGDLKGFRPDATLDPELRDRLEQVLTAAADQDMVVIVGCLYWGTSRAKEELSGWTQSNADRAVANTARWLGEAGFTNVILDPDNEGMATREMDWSAESMIRAAKEANPDLVVANNTKQDPPNEDLNMHFGKPEPGKPWFDSEATPKNAPGGYWGKFSKKSHQDSGGKFYNYSRIGRYTEEMKADQIRQTEEGLTRFNGHIFASTWLQCGPAEGVGGPFLLPGGRSELGFSDDPTAAWFLDIDEIHPDAGFLWWLEGVRDLIGSNDP